ncbi:hypothetical protein L195_g016820 [Trifolium pratense]|uniref:Uncharacterized protein n=1 Tax=Trifolium pratense TaxID=57577 RepID=A0A2K3MS80_TRIPR|nr:hypothetical protein L195_g016820 [Trifolium pratense]
MFTVVIVGETRGVLGAADSDTSPSKATRGYMDLVVTGLHGFGVCPFSNVLQHVNFADRSGEIGDECFCSWCVEVCVSSGVGVCVFQYSELALPKMKNFGRLGYIGGERAYKYVLHYGTRGRRRFTVSFFYLLLWSPDVEV